MSRRLADAPPEAVSPAGQWQAAHAFVSRCRQWAVEELERRAANGKPRHEWESYLRFTDHTLRELEAGTLDAWFRPEGDGPDAGR